MWRSVMFYFVSFENIPWLLWIFGYLGFATGIQPMELFSLIIGFTLLLVKGDLSSCLLHTKNKITIFSSNEAITSKSQTNSRLYDKLVFSITPSGERRYTNIPLLHKTPTLSYGLICYKASRWITLITSYLIYIVEISTRAIVPLATMFNSIGAEISTQISNTR